MSNWALFAAWLVFIVAGLAVAVGSVNEDYAAAQHEVVLDELWGEEA